MSIPSKRLTYALGFIFTTLLLCMSFYLQAIDGLMPCPLCIFQRFTLMLLMFLFFLGFILPYKRIGHFLIASLSLLTTLLGILFSGRQVWLQHLPADQQGDCGVSLQYLLQVLPPDQAIKKIFSGSAECAQVGWQFLHLSLAAWSLIGFILVFVLSLIQLFRVSSP